MLIVFSDLKPRKGIPYCRDHLRRLWKAGKFPKPVDIGPGRLAWVEEEVDAHIQEIVAKRDAPPAPGDEKPPAPAPAIAERSAAPQRRQPARPRGKGTSRRG